MPTFTQIIADAYRKMVNPPQALARPKWVPASITEESVPAFVQAVTEARNANASIIEFNGKKYGIKESVLDEADSGHTAGHFTGDQDSHAKNMASKFGVKTKFKYDGLTGNLSPHYTGKKSAVKAAVLHQYDGDHEMASSVHPHLFNEETKKEADDESKKIQDMDAENAPKQPSDEVPAEVKEEDAEEIKMDNHDEKEADADEMPKLDDDKVEEELVGNQHKLDVNKNGKIDGDDLKKLRSEELVGNQHKLDVNKNGKIDGEDLKKLRGEEKEEDSDEKDADKDDEKDEDEKPKMTGEQVMSSLAATYAAMVNENVAGDPHAHNLTNKANGLTALAHSSDSDTHHEDAQHAHNLAAEHYRVYAHHAGDPQIRSAANIHHEFHRSMANHHMLHLVSADQDREASDAAAKHYGKKSVEEGTAADAQAGPEVMDPATQKMKDDADDETEIKDGVPGAAQDGSDKVTPADKPAAANSSAALPKVSIISPSVTINKNTENMNPKTIKSVGEAYVQMKEDVHSNKFQHPMNSKDGHLERLAHHASMSQHHASFIDNEEGVPDDVHFEKADDHKAYASDHAKAAMQHGASKKEILKHGKGLV